MPLGTVKPQAAVSGKAAILCAGEHNRPPRKTAARTGAMAGHQLDGMGRTDGCTAIKISAGNAPLRADAIRSGGWEDWMPREDSNLNRRNQNP